MNANGLLVVLVAGAIGLGLVVATFVLVFYGLVARNPRRGFVASAAGLAIAVVAALLSAPFWRVVLSGRDTRGEPLDGGSSWPLYAVVAVEATAIAIAAAGTLRQWWRRGSSGP